MSENPFRPPITDSALDSEDLAHRKRWLIVVGIVVVLAVLTGLSFAANFAAPVFVCPVIAMIVVSAVSGHPADEPLKHGFRVGLFILSIAAGWITFATTCCGTNFALVFENLGQNYSPPPVLGGLVCTGTTVLGCLVVYGCHCWYPVSRDKRD